jgi:outer membrane receptor protein involved in Fe transport
MSSNTHLRNAVRLALLTNVSAASLGIPAIVAAADTDQGPPQPAAAAEAEPPVLTEVVVTGSRITQPGLDAISPVTSVSAEQFKEQGVTSVEDLLNTLPQVVADQGSASSNGASGTATVNLRGLGPQRTLVLVNGRRLMPGDPSTKTPAFLAADLNNIPAALVDRVDVLTGGASAVYGADAVAGVVNFVMNDHFEGARIDANAGGWQHSQHNAAGNLAPQAGDGSAPGSVFDGSNKQVTVILGNNFAEGKGNATAYISYNRLGSVLQAARDFSLCTLGTSSKGVVSCSGSSTSATGRFFASNFLPAPNNSVPNFFASPFLTVNTATGQFRPWTNTDAFNFGALNYYQRPDERWSAGAFAHYNWDDKHQVYSEFMFMSDRTIAQIAPSGAFIGSGTGVNPTTGNPDGSWGVNCNNPYLSAQEQSTLCAGLAPTAVAQVLFGRRNVEGGNRQDDLVHTSFRLVLGSKGEINDALSYDVYALEGLTLFSEAYLNDVSRAKLSSALQAVSGPNGTVVCAANSGGASAAPGCVPYNIWGTGPVNPASVAYFTTPAANKGQTEERVISGNVTADLGKYNVKSPLANLGLIVNAGTEYRSEALQLQPDASFIGDGNLSDLAGQGSSTLPLNKTLHVWEGFIEARLPIVQDLPFAKELSFETGYRYSAYTVGFNTNTYKFQMDWSPTSDVRVRGGYNRAVRVPNLTELFATKYVGLDGSTDPCASSSGSPAVATLAQCQRSGLTPAAYGTLGTPGNPAGQYNGLLGGNPNLKPEIADTYTFGFVVTPTMLPNFSATVDYFDIKIRNIITSYTANLIIDQCVNQNVASFCNSIQEAAAVGVHRDAAGSIWFSPNGYVADPLLNLGYLKSRGIDVGAHYHLDLPAAWGTNWGHMDFSLAGTYTSSFLVEPFPGSGTYDCAGYYGPICGNPLPKWKHVFQDTYATPIPGLAFTARWRYLSPTKLETTNASPLLHTAVNPKILSSFTEIPSFSYIDLAASYLATKGVTVRVGVNNLLDKDPPVLAATNPAYSLLPPFFNGNTYPQVYDTLGRYLYANVTVDF